MVVETRSTLHTINSSKRAATRMKSLVWEEKLVRIKAFSIRKETRGFIHEVCFYNGGSNGLRRSFARIVTRRVRFPRLPPIYSSRVTGIDS